MKTIDILVAFAAMAIVLFTIFYNVKRLKNGGCSCCSNPCCSPRKKEKSCGCHSGEKAEESSKDGGQNSESCGCPHCRR
ncbi:MAG: FeoB-associated Cys-rich membrane protein [Opitutales bacterium]|nr:FeoB-associated Cys-rich membrane protein [Opitutales bacterium]